MIRSMNDRRRGDYQYAVATLHEIVGALASPDTTQRFLANDEDQNCNTLELLREFTEFRYLESVHRYQELPPGVEGMLQMFSSTLDAVIGDNWRSTPDCVIVRSAEWRALQAEAGTLAEALTPLLQDTSKG
jgi:hypothetical protein